VTSGLHGVNTKSGVFEIVNVTRYCTDDLLRLFNYVEKRYAITYDQERPAFAKLITVSEYNTKADHPVKLYGKSNELRLVSPARLRVDPLQLLSSAFGDRVAVPSGVVGMVLTRISMLYAISVAITPIQRMPWDGMPPLHFYARINK